MNKKQNCIDYISLNLMRTSKWRRVQAERYPDDQRNDQAAAALWQLAVAATDISEDLWIRLSPLYEPTYDRWSNAVSQASRDVSFRSQPRDFESFLCNIVDALTAKRIAA